MLEVLSNWFDWFFGCGKWENVELYSYSSWFDGSPFALTVCAVILVGIIAVSVSPKLRSKFF